MSPLVLHITFVDWKPCLAGSSAVDWPQSECQPCQRRCSSTNRKPMAAAPEGGPRKQRDWLYLVVDKLVIGLLLVALTLTANWVLDRKRAKDEATQERGRARQALVAEFAKVRTEKITILLQTQARTDHALERLQSDLLAWRAAEENAGDALKRPSLNAPPPVTLKAPPP